MSRPETEETRAAARVAVRNERREKYVTAKEDATIIAKEINAGNLTVGVVSVSRGAAVELCDDGAYVAAYIFVPRQR